MKQILLVFLLIYQTISHAMGPKLNWDKSIEQAIKRYGAPVEPELKGFFSRAGIEYPPKEIALLAFKAERRVELWAKDTGSLWKKIHNYPLTGYSGHLGPKLREYDRQIPEGIYKLVSFNPFSSLHLSMMINYPNAFDQSKASLEGRKKLGNNIFIHGTNKTVGCLAVGNKSIDQLFTLARRVGLNNIKLIISPNDLRYKKPVISKQDSPRWLPELYRNISLALSEFKPQSNS